MSPACFHNAFIFLHESFKGLNEGIQTWKKSLLDFQGCCNMHGCWEGIVGALGHIGMVIGMQKLFSCHFISPIGNDFVHIHVGLGSASGLPYHKRKMLVEFPLQNLIAYAGNQSFASFIQFAKAIIGDCCRLF